MNNAGTSGRRFPLHRRILVGGAIGVAAGVASNLWWAGDPALAGFVRYVSQPLGQVFLRLLFMPASP